jgi:hypothetical protein
MNMRACYLDCHEAGLCCYLVTHIENLLRPSTTTVLLSCVTYLLTIPRIRKSAECLYVKKNYEYGYSAKRIKNTEFGSLIKALVTELRQ